LARGFFHCQTLAKQLFLLSASLAAAPGLMGFSRNQPAEIEATSSLFTPS